MTRLRLIVPTLVAALVLMLAACGSDEAAPDSGNASAKPIGEFTTGQGLHRAYYLVSPGLSDAEVVTLAKRLHEQQPDSWLWLMDDEAQMPQLLESLPQAERGDLSNYPTMWVQQHTVAHSVITVGEGPREWVLFKGADPGTELVAIPR